uniref:THD domain-containing protein n=1 Tax=Nomascus leucogenys TaxID=61853 RepID=A0A2I3G7T1_NOMLE
LPPLPCPAPRPAIPRPPAPDPFFSPRAALTCLVCAGTCSAKLSACFPPTVLLTDGPLSWYSDPGLAGVSLAGGLSYKEDTKELVVAKAGVYYVFFQLELQRVVAGEGSGSVSLALHLQPLRSATGAAALALTVDLPPASSEAPNSAFGFQGRLLHLSAGQRLGIHLHTEARARHAWQLTQGATVLGLFRVTPEISAGLPSPRSE